MTKTPCHFSGLPSLPCERRKAYLFRIAVLAELNIVTRIRSTHMISHCNATSPPAANGMLVTAILTLTLGLAFPAIADTEHAPDRTSPRAAFRTYLLAMVEYITAEDDSVSERALGRAVECLDLGGIPAALRPEQGRELARNLKSFLDRYELVDLDEIPDEYGESRYIWRKPSSKAEVSLLLGQDSLWRFSRKTIASLPHLLDLVRGQDVVEGVDAAMELEGLANWVRSRVPESMRNRAVYFENWQWLAIVFVIIIGIVVERLVITLVSSWVLRLIRRKKTHADFKIDKQLIRPLGIFAMAWTWSLFLHQLDLPLQATTALFFATQLMIAGSGVWAAYRLVDLAAAYLADLAKRTESKFDDLLVPMIRRAMKIVVIAFGLLFVADNFDIDITSLLAGLGIGGIAFALAAKDTVENLFGSMTVMFDKPFEIGDWIKVGDLEGTVEDVGFRSTRIRTFYNSQITMPNSRVVSVPVDNLGRRRYRRISTTLGVQYDTAPEKIDAFCEGIREIIRLHPYTRKDMYMVYFNEYADFSLNILLYVFHETPDWPTELRERHRLFGDILRLAHRMGIQFAFPTQTIHIAGASTTTLDVSSGSSDPGQHVPRTPSDHDPGSGAEDTVTQASFFGRREAQALMRELWGDNVQAPVSFADATSMDPAAARQEEGETQHD